MMIKTKAIHPKRGEYGNQDEIIKLWYNLILKVIKSYQSIIVHQSMLVGFVGGVYLVIICADSFFVWTIQNKHYTTKRKKILNDS